MAANASETLPPVSPYLLSLREDLNRSGKALARFRIGELAVEVRTAASGVFAVLRRPGSGALALRAAFVVPPFTCEPLVAGPGEAVRLRIVSAMGEHRVTLAAGAGALELLRVTTSLTPERSLTLPFSPRDLYPLGRNDDPLAAHGRVEAAQRGLNAGLLYFCLEEPAFGNILYFQNLTALNAYHRQTGTAPDGVVGGAWPELGQLLAPPSADRPPEGAALAAGEPVTLSDALVVVRYTAPTDERDSARQFLQMLGSVYRTIELPPVQYRDWVERAERTARDLAESPDATICQYGHRYLHPYTGGEYPDAMVQMSVIAALHDWGRWRGEAHPLEADLKAGLRKFYDPKLQTLRRYLPNVGKEKNPAEMDSWYLYHPLLKLGMLALDGDEDARALFLSSLDYGIRVARHFSYRWPIQYDVHDFSVVQATAPADGRGETDVGGIYAWVMLQAFELTGDARFLEEAKAAIEAAVGLRFAVNYQANLTAWGAAACMRLWRITDRDVYLQQSYVYLASFFHNSVLWDSALGHATAYQTFMAVTCLQDAPYVAMYECFDTFIAFAHLLGDSGPDLEPEARMLVSEYCKYALSRAWCYYPDALPPQALADTQREGNGFIDPKRSFPLEDLYPDGQPAGQVGQEIYGAGAAFVFVSRAFHTIEGAPFRLFCDYLLRGIERTGQRAVTIQLDGTEGCTANLRLVRLKRRTLPKASVITAGGDAIRGKPSDDRIDYVVPANGRLVLSWD